MLACVMLSSCTKEESDSLVNNTPTDASLWPEGALMTDGDDYYYMGNQRQELNRSESMLYICFSPASYINNLPNNFAVLYPIETSRPDSKGAVVLFSGIDRQTAIEQLKGHNAIYAIEPVYYSSDSAVITPSSSKFYAHVQSLSDTIALHEFADSIHCEIDCTLFHLAWDMGKYIIVFQMDHSLVNSVAASNFLYETGRAIAVDAGFVTPLRLN